METTSSLETRAEQPYSVQDFTLYIFQMNAENTFTTQHLSLHLFHRKKKSILMKKPYKYSQ